MGDGDYRSGVGKKSRSLRHFDILTNLVSHWTLFASPQVFLKSNIGRGGKKEEEKMTKKYLKEVEIIHLFSTKVCIQIK